VAGSLSSSGMAASRGNKRADPLESSSSRASSSLLLSEDASQAIAPSPAAEESSSRQREVTTDTARPVLVIPLVSEFGLARVLEGPAGALPCAAAKLNNTYLSLPPDPQCIACRSRD
jgi:hypothetical protein